MLDGDQFIEDPLAVLQSVERFLQIPSFFTDQHFTHNGDIPIGAYINLSVIREKRLPMFQT